jgi:amino acid adenylation domain-containing protein
MTNHDSEALLLHDFLTQSAAHFPHKVALTCDKHDYTYTELDTASSAVARALRQRGVERGDRVVVYAENSVETVISFWAVLKADAVVSIVNPQTRADKLKYLLNDCRPSAFISDIGLRSSFEEAVRAAPSVRAVLLSGPATPSALSQIPRAEAFEKALRAGATSDPLPRRALDIDLAAIVYTSGSTGDAKGVMLTHRNMLTAARSITTYLENTSEDVILNVLPMSFDYGLYQMIMAFRVGARLVLEKSFTYPAQVLNTVVSEKVTGFPGVPTIFAMLAEFKSLSSFDLSRIRYVSNTAAALATKHIEFLKQTFPKARLYSMYGLTECKRVSYLPPDDLDRKPGSVGLPIPNTEVWVVDEHDQRVAPGEVGQLVVRGATVMRGYWEKPEQTAKKLRPGPLPGEHVLYTGDYAKLDEDGYLYFVGRMDDIIKSRGEKVAPKEVENVIVGLPGVKETAVIGVPDPVLGDAVKAFVVLEQGASVDETTVLRHCQKHLEGFMVPKYVVFIDELPKTSSGKITKVGLV